MDGTYKLPEFTVELDGYDDFNPLTPNATSPVCAFAEPAARKITHRIATRLTLFTIPPTAPLL
jgi:hypothetical protein